MKTLDIIVGNIPRIDIELTGVVINPVIGDAENYEGEYTVIPSPNIQTLFTAKKYLTQDINVRGVPLYEISNEAGGVTTIIGG